ncbi:uncharacterized protein BXZ73DRAFT_103537 [Epithele typhae]|uniref:uncharacterized protein n=1 Tax=Epithele typhae TaxID=378194 RepID=UPI002008DFFA|nr:uncharacterized protein BXZ73DRAFT_103537 [Epithele typhae]KAH9924696.1 hypothetical protein BXZ73DRAFT_103537 [Epithele typhae]
MSGHEPYRPYEFEGTNLPGFNSEGLRTGLQGQQPPLDPFLEAQQNDMRGTRPTHDPTDTARWESSGDFKPNQNRKASVGEKIKVNVEKLVDHLPGRTH